MIRRPPISTLFPSRRSSDLSLVAGGRERLGAGGAPALPGAPAGGQGRGPLPALERQVAQADRKSTRLNSSHLGISYAVFCLKKKKQPHRSENYETQERHTAQ